MSRVTVYNWFSGATTPTTGKLEAIKKFVETITA